VEAVGDVRDAREMLIDRHPVSALKKTDVRRAGLDQSN